MRSTAPHQALTQFLTLPNILTFFRLVLVPLFLHQMIRGKTFEALLIFLAASLTDLLDGFVARTWNVRTSLGRILDPAADKLLLVSAFIASSIPQLSHPFHVPGWLVSVVVCRDIVLALGAFILFCWKGIKTFSPSLSGKISTFLQVLTVLLILAGNAAFQHAFPDFKFLQSLSSPWLQETFFLLTFAATAVSGIQYIAFGVKKAFFSLD